MLGRHRVAEFHGAGELPRAGETLLTDPNLDLVIVHGLRTDRIAEAASRLGTTAGVAELKATVTADIPTFSDLDLAVQGWVQNQPAISQLNVAPPFAAGRYGLSFRHDGIPPHVDESYGDREHFGPVAASLRLDEEPIERTFHARRTNIATIQNGHLSGEGLRATKQDLLDTGESLAEHYSSITQRCGDMVLIANQPTLTAHAVEETHTGAERSPHPQTTTLIMHYMLSLPS
jgi:hypothetical protein